MATEYVQIQETDSLDEGRKKINIGLKDSNEAVTRSIGADKKADKALATSEGTQEQLDTIVVEGDSSVEAAQARNSISGETYDTLKQRLDSEYERNEIEKASVILSKTEPDSNSENVYWYEDVGEPPIDFDLREAVMIANAELREDQPENTRNFWFQS